MCAVSVIYDYAGSIEESINTQFKYDQLLSLIEEAKKLDKSLGMKKCSDPKKKKIINKIRRKLRNA